MPILDNMERSTSAWLRVKEHIEKRIETLRKQNDSDKPDLATAKLRGRIAELKELLAAVEPTAPAPVAEDEEHLS